MSNARFQLGRVDATPGAIEAFGENAIPIFDACLARHVTGDWGEVPPEDAQANEDALRDGERVLSAYQLGGRRLWVITEADRTSTTLLLPEEY